MNSHKPIQISIPHPCNQNWDDMTSADKGRFCDHCQKTVIDFTTWSDTDLYNFLSKKDNHVCGRFLSTQVNRPIYIPPQSHSRLYRMVVALGLALIINPEQYANAQSRPPLATQTSVASQPLAPLGCIYEIRGQVVDDLKQPFISATVQVLKEGILVGASSTDIDGFYVVKLQDPGPYQIIVAVKGYDSLTINGIYPGATPVNISIPKPKLYYMGSISTIIQLEPPYDPPGRRTYTREELNHRW